ncbi:DUF4082 domain-containing protein [Microbacterium allomyrinae]|uniref:DUF4082 domain-containing protein n=1 Tax=Microbacterium allomyrinae TaxID=2830666 RepID=A0A9X1LVB8_9MICO|nr:DUF4082 domain-containing protein [Microbacterium allomyrinae]MCC2032695.1 DUF4082 domain-containing protein [Microbacterium allomyrinae]
MALDDLLVAPIGLRRSRRKRLISVLAAFAVAAAVGASFAAADVAHAATPVGVISDTATPQILTAPETKKIEVGLQFSPTTSGTLSGVQFYQNATNSGVTSASVWSSTGTLLTRVAVNPSAPVGWRTVPVNVRLEAGRTYTVSVYDSNSRFPATENVFTTARTTAGLSTPANAGVYRYTSASAFPSTGEAYSFLVDAVFTSDAAAPTPVPVATSAPAATPTPSATPTPTPTPTPTATVAPEQPAADPETETAVYGPDGTHWPANTPRADAARVVNVAATWTAISSAIVANSGSADPVVICVAPGTITGGSGATSSAKGVLQNVGNAARASRILVTACGGVGTVKIAAGTGIAFVGVKGVSIVGIDLSAQPVMIRNTESFAIGYSEVPRLLVTANGDNGVRDVEIVEIVAGPEAFTGATYDRVEVKSAGGYNVEGVRFAGFYGAPQYKPNGSSSHVDTLQFVTTSGTGTITDVTIEDSVLFQSSDQGIMAGGNGAGAITHSAFFGGATGQLRYPVYAGGDPITLANLLHGTWSNVSVADAIVAGSISASYSFTQVVESMSAAGGRGFSTLGALTLADIDRLAPMPTAARLASIWD